MQQALPQNIRYGRLSRSTFSSLRLQSEVPRSLVAKEQRHVPLLGLAWLTTPFANPAEHMTAAAVWLARGEPAACGERRPIKQAARMRGEQGRTRSPPDDHLSSRLSRGAARSSASLGSLF
eukprot:scaffold155363_cov35-Tisochrysis_lutea.AAC.6